MEIIDDQANIIRYLEKLRFQVMNGTSLLYDLEPLYLSISLGSCGFTDTNLLSDYHIARKNGTKIKENDYFVTIMRHKTKYANFKVIAMNAEEGEEFVLDLDEKDLFMLVGD
jgi:hypothetical protein